MKEIKIVYAEPEGYFPKEVQKCFEEKLIKDCGGIREKKIDKEKVRFSYNKAKKVALSICKNINACIEYENAYYFFEKGCGCVGGLCDIVVLKETGQTMSFLTFIENYRPVRRGKSRKF